MTKNKDYFSIATRTGVGVVAVATLVALAQAFCSVSAMDNDLKNLKALAQQYKSAHSKAKEMREKGDLYRYDIAVKTMKSLRPQIDSVNYEFYNHRPVIVKMIDPTSNHVR